MNNVQAYNIVVAVTNEIALKRADFESLNIALDIFKNLVEKDDINQVRALEKESAKKGRA